jgi:mRNA interferase MazF
MTSYEFGDIVLAPFPFTDQTTTKKRPAIVVSSATYHHERPDLIIMAVTSQLRPSAAIGEVFITSWREAGLLKPSAIKPIVTTIERGLILRKLGRLEMADRQALQHVLQTILGAYPQV